MSHNPYTGYTNSSSSSSSPDLLHQDSRQQRSHWSNEYDKTGKSRGNFVEKFSPPTSMAYTPSIRSNNSEFPRSDSYHGKQQPWVDNGRHGSFQSEVGSLPSYHDSPGQSHDGLESGKVTGFRKQLDSGNRARIYLFIAMCSGMLLLFVFTALVWVGLDIIKKKPVYGLNNKVDHTVRPA